MKRHTLFALALPLVCTVLSGCASLRRFTTPDDQNLLSGAGSIMKSAAVVDGKPTVEGFEEIDLPALLAQYGLADPVDVASQQVGKAEEYRYRRNDLQERLVAASNQRCGAYIRTIVSSKSQTQMGWTGLSILLSGAAAVVPHAATAQALAAGSTASTGLLSTYNEAYFNNLTVTVVSAGIAKQRDSILASMAALKTKTLSDYPVSAAVADALAYHAACNIVTGMEAAAKATSSASTAAFAPLSR